MGNIAIIGTGISGLGAAYLLNPKHRITVYEKAERIGGHTRARTINYNGKTISVDTGFIVFNYRNYPELSAMFKHLDVPVQKSNMSFGVTADNGALEWSAQNVNGLFGQRSNLVNPKFYQFLLDIVRFNTGAITAVKKNPTMTLGELIAHMGLGKWFSEYYILPMGGAIWSCTLDSILQFPAKAFVDFFEAHGLLTVTQQPQWYTVTGSSDEYVKRLTQSFKETIRLSCGAVAVTRTGGKVQVKDTRGEVLEYDHVVFACHADEALAIIQDSSAEEKKTLGAFGYQSNIAVLHKDTSIMPKRKSCWASWVYHAEKNPQKEGICVTYWMNQLQSIDNKYPVFITLNPQREIAPEHVFDTHKFEHPVYSMAAVAAQAELPQLQSKRNTWFCGAYHRNGFHEDGLASGVAVAKSLGAEVPWH